VDGGKALFGVLALENSFLKRKRYVDDGNGNLWIIYLIFIAIVLFEIVKIGYQI